MGENPDQRIHQDAQRLAELTTDLCIGLAQSTLLLLTFVGVLWVLSSHMVLSIGRHTFSVPGYMVWCALLYAGAASFLSWRVGRPLVELNAQRYAREADFRYALVRANQQIEATTLSGREADERARLDAVFETVIDISWRIAGAATGLTWVTAGYGWFTIIAPILVAAAAYFQSEMSFGELMVSVGAFNQVQSALRWFVDNFSGIADWRATLLRVAIFRQEILTMDGLSPEGGQAIVGNVNARAQGAGARKKSEELPRALAYASSVAAPRQIETERDDAVFVYPLRSKSAAPFQPA